MSVRKRPVITVVDARPMDQVGFRDTRVASGSSDIPKLSPPPSKGPPVSRPTLPTNMNTAASSSDSDAIYGIPRKPVTSENRMPSDRNNALILDNQLNKASNPPPPKPRRTGEPRPMTIHIDGLNNNILPDRPLQPPKPVASKRASVRPDEASKDTAPDDAWNTNIWGLDPSPSSTKVKPEVAAKRPTIIRASTSGVKSESDSRPPPVATKSLATKQQAAERLSISEDTSCDPDGFVKPHAKPKPASRAKPETGIGADVTEDRPQPPEVRKRPTIIRPSSVHGSFGMHGASGLIPRSELNQSGPNSSAPNALPRGFPPSETPPEKLSAPTRTTPTIIRPGFVAPGPANPRPELSVKQPEVMTRQELEISSKYPEKPGSAFTPIAPQPKKRPNIIRPSAEASRRTTPESTVTIASGTVHFSASGTSAPSSLPQGTGASPDVPPERQNEENWKRIEKDDRRSVVPTRSVATPFHDPTDQDRGSRKPPQSELRQPPSKPPPPRVTKSSEVGKPSASNDSKSQSSDSMASSSSHQSGPPPRPAAGPTMRPTRPTQPTKRTSTVAGMAPSLPRRPTLGHPLFHYVASGPHAIALFDYQPTQPDELQFKAGTVILLEKWINKEWLLGRTAQASGMFPCSFVDIVEAPRDASDGASATTVFPVASSSLVVEGGASSAASWPGMGPRCCARFDYDGEDAADLAFAAGDIIRLMERVGNEWMKGELNGKVGMFPVGFVEVIEDLPPAADSASASLGPETGSTVLFDFLGQPGELSLLSGTRVKILGVVNSEWLYGESEEQKGRFPRAFVDHVPLGLPLFEDQLPPETTHDKVTDGAHCVALYDFVGQSSDDLSFSAGDFISILAHISDDWLRGELKGRSGIFPASFVQIVKDVDELPPRPKSDDAALVDLSHNMAAHDNSNINVLSTLSDKSEFVPPTEKSTQAVAIYDFPGQTADDLTFQTGEVIEVTGVIDSDWMSGRIGERVGIFPTSFVNILS